MNKIIKETSSFIIHEYKDNANIYVYRNKSKNTYFIFDSDDLNKIESSCVWDKISGNFRIRPRVNKQKVSIYLDLLILNLETRDNINVVFKKNEYVDYRKSNLSYTNKNTYVINSETNLVELNISNGNHTVLLDIDDYDVVSQFIWYVDTGGYVVRQDHENNKNVKLHRYICEQNDFEIENLEIDHFDRNKLNNSKSNFRICTRRENMHNINKLKSNKSGTIGVFKRKIGETEYWIAKWYTSEGVSKTQSFNISTFGEKEAYEMAVSLRAEKEKQFSIFSN